jgi:hypothetical protein
MTGGASSFTAFVFPPVTDPTVSFMLGTAQWAGISAGSIKIIRQADY